MADTNFTRFQGRRRSSVRINELPRAPIYTEPVTFRYEIQNHTSRMQKITKAFKVYRLMALTVICIVVGLVVGLVCRPYAKDWTERHFMYIEMPGELYLRTLKLMIVPLLMSNVILSFGTIQGKLSSHLGKLSSLLYLTSNLLAITVAIVLALLISPGKHRSPSLIPVNEIPQESLGIVSDYQGYSSLIQHASPHQSIGNHTVNEKSRILSGYDTNQTELNEQWSAQSDLSMLINVKVSSKSPPKIFKVAHYLTVNGSAGERAHRKPDKINYNSPGTSLPIDIILDLLRNLVPDNLIALSLYQTKTYLHTPQELVIGINGTTDPPPSSWPISHERIEQANIIGLLTVSVITGIILSHMDESGQPMLKLCACISELSLRFNMLAINLTPACIMFLLIGQVARIRDLSSTIGVLSMYLFTVIAALIIHGFLFLPVIYWIITKKSPISFLHHLLDVLVAAFATSSSSATLAPLVSSLMQFNLNPVVVRAFGPLGSVFNMNGTTIYEIVGCVFMAQIMDVDLTLTSILLIGLTSAVAGLSTVGVPSSGMMTIVIVLDATNTPILPLSLIYIFDFIIDRFRTVVNVWSGAIVCALIDYMCPERLFDEAMEHNKFLELMRFRPQSKKESIKSRGGSIGRNPSEEQKSQVISVTITPPTEASDIATKH